MKSPSFKFTERDSDILFTLYKHRFLTISQIQRILFPSMQTAYRRMRLLKNAGLVSSFAVANIPESIFAVAKRGLRHVASCLGVDVENLKWNDTRAKPRDYYFMRHFIAINDFRIELARACESTSVRLLGFLPDYYGERTPSGGVAKYIRDSICDITPDREEVSHTPDGVFALKRDNNAALFFLEIDRGTETVSRADKGVLKSVRFYINYLIDGKYQRYAKDFKTEPFKGFRALYVTTSEERLVNIRKAAGDYDISDKAKRFLWITTSDQTGAKSLLGAIWRSLDNKDDSQYAIIS